MLATVVALAAAVECGAASSYPDLRFDFALIGDTPYNERQETNEFPNLLEELNSARLNQRQRHEAEACECCGLAYCAGRRKSVDGCMLRDTGLCWCAPAFVHRI